MTDPLHDDGPTANGDGGERSFEQRLLDQLRQDGRRSANGEYVGRRYLRPEPDADAASGDSGTSDGQP